MKYFEITKIFQVKKNNDIWTKNNDIWAALGRSSNDIKIKSQ